jgi:hypothetical protein
MLWEHDAMLLGIVEPWLKAHNVGLAMRTFVTETILKAGWVLDFAATILQMSATFLPNAGLFQLAADEAQAAHYTRPPVAMEEDIENPIIAGKRKTSGLLWNQKYQAHLSGLRFVINTAPAMTTRLIALGFLSHSYQDFYAHAVRLDMKGATRINVTDPRALLCGSENSHWPGFSAFADVNDPVSGNPEIPGPFIPSSWPAEHPSNAEPVLLTSPEGLARYKAAKDFLKPKVEAYLQAILFFPNNPQ